MDTVIDFKKTTNYQTLMKHAQTRIARDIVLFMEKDDAYLASAFSSDIGSALLWWSDDDKTYQEFVKSVILADIKAIIKDEKAALHKRLSESLGVRTATDPPTVLTPPPLPSEPIALPLHGMKAERILQNYDPPISPEPTWLDNCVTTKE